MRTNRLAHLLLVEDEDRLRGLVAQFLRGEGFRSSRPATAPKGSSGSPTPGRSTWSCST